jgi:hypothetical protein
MAEQLHRFGVEVLAWCLMTNHTHLVRFPKTKRPWLGPLETGSDITINTVLTLIPGFC